MMECSGANCTTKRYNQFRLTRKKNVESAPMEIDFDETKGRLHKLERFLNDCMNYLLSQELPKEGTNCTAAESEEVPDIPKRKKAKHVKLPVLNESRGLFENVIIGRSAKRSLKLADIAATPEDRARLQEDIHALARVGPDSERSLEMIPPMQHPDVSPNSPNNHAEAPQDTEDGERCEVSLRESAVDVQDTVNVPEQPVESPHSMVQQGNCDEIPNQVIPSRSDGSLAENEIVNSPVEFFRQDNPTLVDYFGFKDTVGSQKEDKSSRAGSRHCECCQRRSSREKSFFDADVILKSNETGANERRNVGRSINEIFSNHRARRSAVLKEWSRPGSPSNLVGSTYPSRSFHLPGIEIQSRAVSRSDCVDVYCGSRPKDLGSSRVSTSATDFNKVWEPIRAYNDFIPSAGPSHHVNKPYSKYRYDRSLSPRKY